MKTAVQIGAGNIGRGFLSQIFRDSGYRVIFIDINQALVDAINNLGNYQIELADNRGIEIKTIDQITAVSGRDFTATAIIIAKADVMAVSVGVSALEKIAPMLAAGLQQRGQNGNLNPLNVLVCENMLNAPGVLRQYLDRHLSKLEQENLPQTVGLVETSIGRMVPGHNPHSDKDILTVRVEPYCKLPVDRDGFIGGIPDLKYLEPFSPFVYIIRRKLFIHNLGHAILAYLGYALKKEFIWEAVADEHITGIVRYTLEQVAKALAVEYGINPAEIHEHIENLMQRFTNRALGDTVERVGRDSRRKLGPEDRIMGSFRLLAKHDLDTATFPLLIAAGLRFAPPGDEGAAWVQELISKEGIVVAVQQVCGLRPDEVDQLLPGVQEYYNLLLLQPRAACNKMYEYVKIKST